MGDSVSIKNFPTGDSWLPGTVVKSSGPLSFHVQLQDGRIIRRHIDHIILRSTTTSDEPNDDWISMPDVAEPNATESNATEQSTTVTATTPPPLRRSTRVSVPPKRYGQHTT